MTDAQLEIPSEPDAPEAPAPPRPAGSLETRIADAARVPVEDVRNVFTTYGLPLVLTPARPRDLRLTRLRIAGVRAGKIAPGPFDTTLTFQNGMTALVASNFRGKTSVLELITWCLRGTPRELQSGVRRWLQHLDLDATVAGQPLGFRLDLTDGEISSATVLTAPAMTDLASLREPDPSCHVTTLLEAADPASYVEQVASLMLDRLDLSPVVNTLKDTNTQTHGWPMYFGAVYLGSASTKVLLGEHATGGQAGRLLQVFLDLPAAAVLTRVKAAHDVRANQAQARKAAQRQAVDGRASERARLVAELAAARTKLAELTAATGNSQPLSELARTAATLASRVADARAAHDEFLHVAQLARAARQQAAKRLADVRESGIARALFQGLDPTSCPRCDQVISGERRQEERDTHACAVCARPVPDDDPAPADVTAEAEARLADATTAERECRADADEAKTELERLTTELADADDRLRQARAVAALPDLLEAQTRVWRLDGGLAVMPELAPDADDLDSGEAVVLRVLAAAAKVLEEGEQGRGREPLHRPEHRDRRPGPPVRYELVGEGQHRPLSSAPRHPGRRRPGLVQWMQQGTATATAHRGHHRPASRRSRPRSVDSPGFDHDRQPEGGGSPGPGRRNAVPGAVGSGVQAGDTVADHNQGL